MRAAAAAERSGQPDLADIRQAERELGAAGLRRPLRVAIRRRSANQ